MERKTRKSNKYILVYEFDSRYDESNQVDIDCLIKKLIDYGELIKAENNKGSLHVGLHFNLTNVRAARVIE